MWGEGLLSFPKATLLVLVILSFLLLACANEGDPAETTQDYLNALAERDRDTLLRLTCADEDADLQRRLDSFPAGATVEGMQCERQDDKDNSAIVACEGNFVWTYKDQNNERPLGNWQLVKEDDEWRVCGAAP